MRVTIVALGLTFDLSLEPTVEQAGDDDRGRDLSGGTLASTVVGFTSGYDVPAEVDLPQRTPAWDEPEERR